jgi:hypothetical protein
MQLMHKFEGLGAITVPQEAHRLETKIIKKFSRKFKDKCNLHALFRFIRGMLHISSAQHFFFQKKIVKKKE